MRFSVPCCVAEVRGTLFAAVGGFDENTELVATCCICSRRGNRGLQL